MKESKKSSRTLAIVMLVYFVIAGVFYWASGEQLYYTNEYTDTVTPTTTAAIMSNGTEVQFPVTLNSDYSDYISILIGTVARENEGSLQVELLDEQNQVLASQQLATKGLVDYQYQHVFWPQPVKIERGGEYIVRITAMDVPEDQGVSLWYGDSISTGRFTVQVSNLSEFTVNGETVEGTLCFKTAGRNDLIVGKIYWPVVLILAVCIFAYGLKTISARKKGKTNFLIRMEELTERYSFLVRQLVSRDFKRKYKRSVLGVCWSFLNPLLTMAVQYLVFNTLFKSSIDNFVVYLLSGIVLFNFFAEAVNLGLTSITDNAHLINKVYMPKEIYPFSRALSATVNLLIALIPLLGATLLSGLPITKAILLLPIGLLLLFMFSLGLGMLLGTSMVYFRDTQFLWSVVSILWTYLTPTFYPITIVPAALLPIFKMNPMYLFITFARTILIEGIAPSPMVYLGCVVSAFGMLWIGWSVFKKHQKNFVLHL